MGALTLNPEYVIDTIDGLNQKDLPCAKCGGPTVIHEERTSSSGREVVGTRVCLCERCPVTTFTHWLVAVEMPTSPAASP